MDEAVDRVLEQKYGEDGAYTEPSVFGHAYRKQDDARWYLKHGHQYEPAAIDYVKEVCRYIWDTYGRFPAHVDAMYQPGTWLQVAHLEMGYYDRYFQPWQYPRQATHRDTWHK